MNFTHDVIVIGGGAAGLTAAGGCALFGLEVALIEAREMGGECLNDGCVPSKALIAAARRAQEARTPLRHGVMLARPRVDWRGIHAHIHAAIAAIAPHDSQERFEEMGCEVFRDWARVTGKHTVKVGKRTLSAPRIVIATGSSPAIPPIAGLAQVSYLTNETLFDLTERPEHLVVVGGGAIGMEMAQAFCRLGSAVTLVEPGELLARDDADNVAIIRRTMEEEGVRFVSGKAARVEARGDGIRLHVEKGEAIEGSHLLIATGRKPNASGFGLEEIGVEIGEGGIVVDKRRRTSLKHIYAIGDCRDGPRLTHISGYEGSNVALEITLGLPTKVDWSALPWCTYTAPEVAQVGMTEKAARERHGDGVTVVVERFDDNERAIADGDTAGQLKLVLKGKNVLGASIVGKNAGEMLLPFSQSITGKSSSFALGSAVIAYPTRSEISKAASFTAWEPTVFGSVPKKWAQTLAKLRRRLA